MLDMDKLGMLNTTASFDEWYDLLGFLGVA